MKKLLYNPLQIVTINTDGRNVKRGKELSEPGVITDHSIIVEDDTIKDLIPTSSIQKNKFEKVFDLNGKIILPGLVECHTHSVFTGSRADEFRQKLAGTDYETIAAAGGGINSTVKAVRNSSFEELVKTVGPRIEYFIQQGVTTLEIKSGYGLDFENEIKLLQVIKYLDEIYSIDIIPTFLGAHTIPPEAKNNRNAYLENVIMKMLPHIAEQNLAVFCDGFCEPTAFTAEEIDLIFSTAKKSGLKLKLHTEQFNNIGGIDVALNHSAVSVDHLEVIKDTDIYKFSDSNTVAVLLPGVSFFLDYQYAPARKLIDNNAIVALATDYNPGSSHISNINLVMSIAALKMKMSIEETISAVTINSAKALCLQNILGSIEPGKKADFSVFNCKEYSDIIYNVGKNLNCITFKNGEIIYDSSGDSSY